MNVSKIIVGLVASAFIGSAFAFGDNGPRSKDGADVQGSAPIHQERDHKVMKKVVKEAASNRAGNEDMGRR